MMTIFEFFIRVGNEALVKHEILFDSFDSFTHLAPITLILEILRKTENVIANVTIDPRSYEDAMEKLTKDGYIQMYTNTTADQLVARVQGR